MKAKSDTLYTLSSQSKISYFVRGDPSWLLCFLGVCGCVYRFSLSASVCLPSVSFFVHFCICVRLEGQREEHGNFLFIWVFDFSIMFLLSLLYKKKNIVIRHLSPWTCLGSVTQEQKGAAIPSLVTASLYRTAESKDSPGTCTARHWPPEKRPWSRWLFKLEN